MNFRFQLYRLAGERTYLVRYLWNYTCQLSIWETASKVSCIQITRRMTFTCNRQRPYFQHPSLFFLRLFPESRIYSSILRHTFLNPNYFRVHFIPTFFHIKFSNNFTCKIEIFLSFLTNNFCFIYFYSNRLD